MKTILYHNDYPYVNLFEHFINCCKSKLTIDEYVTNSSYIENEDVLSLSKSNLTLFQFEKNIKYGDLYNNIISFQYEKINDKIERKIVILHNHKLCPLHIIIQNNDGSFSPEDIKSDFSRKYNFNTSFLDEEIFYSYLFYIITFLLPYFRLVENEYIFNKEECKKEFYKIYVNINENDEYEFKKEELPIYKCNMIQYQKTIIYQFNIDTIPPPSRHSHVLIEQLLK